MLYEVITVSSEWAPLVQQTMALLQEESELDEIVRLVGIDALSFKDRLTLECTRITSYNVCYTKLLRDKVQSRA